MGERKLAEVKKLGTEKRAAEMREGRRQVVQKNQAETNLQAKAGPTSHK